MIRGIVGAYGARAEAALAAAEAERAVLESLTERSGEVVERITVLYAQMGFARVEVERAAEALEEVDRAIEARARFYLQRSLEAGEILEGVFVECGLVEEQAEGGIGEDEYRRLVDSWTWSIDGAAQPAGDESAPGVQVMDLRVRYRDTLVEIKALHEGIKNADRLVDGSYADMLRENGLLAHSRSELDRRCLRSKMDLTGDITKLEAELDQIKRDAQQAGIDIEDQDQESAFIDHASDGYGIEVETKLVVSGLQPRVLDWIATVTGMRDPELTSDSHSEVDDWDYRDVAFEDSISCVAPNAWSRKKVTQWKTECERSRPFGRSRSNVGEKRLTEDEAIQAQLEAEFRQSMGN